MISIFATILFSVIELLGVRAVNLEAFSSFDTHNVSLGDPMTLTVDFIGEANFETLHPPALSRYINKEEWKVDDKSAKTSTYQNARRLEYRVRPIKDGLLWFPQLEFTCPSEDGAKIYFKTSRMPVYVRKGVQAVLSGLEEDMGQMPMPEAISLVAPDTLTQDDKFRWRKACVTLDPELFAMFSFPRARLNEAACRIIKGEWAKALSIYSKLEWVVGQTPEVERGIKAALALKYDNPHVVLPIWREVGRPVLKYSWLGRLVVIVSALLSIYFVFYLASRLVRIAAIIVMCMILPVSADVFSEMHRQIQQMHEEMSRSFGGVDFAGGGITIASERFDSKDAKLSIKVPENVVAGSSFDLELKIEYPVNVDLGRMNLSVNPDRALKFAGQAKMFKPEVVVGEATNKVQKIIVPLVYLAPFDGDFSVELMGTASMSIKTSANSFYSFRKTSNNFKLKSDNVKLQVSPLPAEGMMDDFRGIVGEIKSMKRFSPERYVRTNDVVVVFYDMEIDGFVPEGAIEDSVANTKTNYKWRRFFFADGKAKTPTFKLPYYDTVENSYKYAEFDGVNLAYKQDEESSKKEKNKAIDIDEQSKSLRKLYFAPDEKSPIVGHTSKTLEKCDVKEKYGDWLRVDDGERVGWIRADQK